MALKKAVIVPPQPEQPGQPPVNASAPGVLPIVLASEGKAAVPAKPEAIVGQTTYFELPLLTIIPFNSLAVDKMNIDFDLEITATKSKPSTLNNESNNNITDEKPQLYGKISYDPNNGNANESKSPSKKQLSSKLKVNINAATLPLPQGILTIIDLYSKSINPTTNT